MKKSKNRLYAHSNLVINGLLKYSSEERLEIISAVNEVLIKILQREIIDLEEKQKTAHDDLSKEIKEKKSLLNSFNKKINKIFACEQILLTKNWEK